MSLFASTQRRTRRNRMVAAVAAVLLGITAVVSGTLASAAQTSPLVIADAVNGRSLVTGTGFGANQTVRFVAFTTNGKGIGTAKTNADGTFKNNVQFSQPDYTGPLWVVASTNSQERALLSSTVGSDKSVLDKKRLQPTDSEKAYAVAEQRYLKISKQFNSTYAEMNKVKNSSKVSAALRKKVAAVDERRGPLMVKAADWQYRAKAGAESTSTERQQLVSDLTATLNSISDGLDAQMPNAKNVAAQLKAAASSDDDSDSGVQAVGPSNNAGNDSGVQAVAPSNNSAVAPADSSGSATGSSSSSSSTTATPAAQPAAAAPANGVSPSIPGGDDLNAKIKQFNDLNDRVKANMSAIDAAAKAGKPVNMQQVNDINAQREKLRPFMNLADDRNAIVAKSENKSQADIRSLAADVLNLSNRYDQALPIAIDIDGKTATLKAQTVA